MTTIKKIKSLNLSGGGMYGIAHVAVLKHLEENYLHYLDIQEIRGTSVGSMVAALYAIGYTMDEMTTILHEIDFDNLVKDNYFAYYNLYNNLGMYHATKLEDKMEELIRNKTNIKLCTFSQIEKDLIIITTNLNYQCPKFLNKKNTPDLPISKAIRMSIGYPGIMKPVLFEGDYYSDGGETINYPLITIEPDKLDEAIGITFAAHNENLDGTLKNRIPINNITDFFKSLGLTLSRSVYTSQLKEEHLKRSIVITIDQDINSMQFNLTKEQKQYIYDCGIKAVQEQIYTVLGISNDYSIDKRCIIQSSSSINSDTSIINSSLTNHLTNLEKLLDVSNVMSIEPIVEVLSQAVLMQ